MRTDDDLQARCYEAAKWLSAKKKALRVRQMPEAIMAEYAALFGGGEPGPGPREHISSIWRDIAPIP